MREDDQPAGQKFWRYVRSLDRKANAAPQMVDTSTGKQDQDLKELVTAKLSSLYGSLQISPSRAREAQPTKPTIPDP